MRCRWWLVLIFMLMLSMAGGCRKDLPRLFSNNYKPEQEEIALPKPSPADKVEEENTREICLYYPDQKKRFLVPVNRRVPRTDTIVRSTLEKLVTSSELNQQLASAGLSPALPLHTDIRGISIKDNLARVDFSASVLTYPDGEARLVLNSIYCTVRQFDNIDQVFIMVEGVALDELSGDIPGELLSGPDCWINLEISDDLDDYREYTAVKLYFIYAAPENRFFYVPVTRVLPPQEDPIGASIAELLGGPGKNSGLISDIPPGTKLLGFNVEEGTIIVDFSREILKYRGGLTGEENVVKQVVLTLTEFSSVERVKILIEGEDLALPQGTDLSLPLSRPPSYNSF